MFVEPQRVDGQETLPAVLRAVLLVIDHPQLAIRTSHDAVMPGADPTRVDVWLRDSPLGGVEKIVVVDDGEGIDVTRVDAAYEHLGLSWKRTAKTTGSGRPLHGHYGRGRFRACTLVRIPAIVIAQSGHRDR